MNGIKIRNITKRYGDVLALDNVSFTLEHGKIYGFLGRNGAGKSTLMNIISNRIFADDGTVFIDDLSAIENMQVHEKIFCMSETDLYSEGIKIKDLFKWIGRFYDSFEIDTAFDIAEKFNLNLNKKFKQLSTGYQSIFKLTVALSLNVPFVIFDEPVLGLDANHRDLFYKLLLQDYEYRGRTIIIATHLIEEVANLIEEVILIDAGKVLLQENVETVLAKGYSVSGATSEVDEYCANKNVIGCDELGALKIVYILGDKSPLPQNSNLIISTMNLQKLFIKLTEKGGN